MRLFAAAGLIAFAATPLAAQDLPMKPAYPESTTVPVVDTLHGQRIDDPYRWLEDDVRVNPKVAEWVAAQNRVTADVLAKLPGRDALKARMTQLIDYERTGVPVTRGGRLFFTRNSGLQNQAVLYVQEADGARRVLIDPNSWSQDGATALGEWSVSDDGTKLAYAVQDGGSDWRTIRFMDVATGETLADEIKWAKFTALEWIGPDALVYGRFPAPAEGAAFQSLNTDQAIYYHKLGTPQSADVRVYATPDRPELNHFATATHDDRWLVIGSASGTDDRGPVQLVPLGKGSWRAQTLIDGFDESWRLVDGIGDRLWFVTDKDAPRRRLVMVDMGGGAPVFTEVVAEAEATLEGAAIIGDRLLLSYLKDAKSEVRIAALDGSAVRTLDIGAIGTLAGVSGSPRSPVAYYGFTSFTVPGVVRRLDVATGATSSFAEPKLTFDPAAYETEQIFYPSKDGTKIPLFIVRKRDVKAKGPAPTLLYGYGGFDISLTPAFSATRMAWLEAGGVYAQASLRGGGEYGKAWHDAGRLKNKQNVFDDFAAAGEWLIANGVTGKDQLAIEGRSNGGLLVGATVNQRPELFAAAHAAVGVMDMLRFDRFTAGRYWVDDYGVPAKAEDFAVLRAYSPYHNIRPGTYPAVIVSTADTDDRVVPGHSFKYVARLQATEAGDKPHVIRVETRAGHGAGKPTDKLIAEYADIYAFLAAYTGLSLAP